MSLIFKHAPQAYMLGVDSSPILFFIRIACTFEYAAPEGGQYNEVLASDYGGYNTTSLFYMHIWLGGVVGYFAESKFSPIFCKTFLFLIDLAPRDEAQVHQQFFP